MKKCHEVMTQIPRCCLPTETLAAVAQIMKMEDVGSIPVVENFETERLVGILTDRDIAIKMAEKDADPNLVNVNEVMTRNPVTCREEDDVEMALDAMARHQIRRIPVIDVEQRILGIIAQSDVAMRLEELAKTGEIVREISKPNPLERHD